MSDGSGPGLDHIGLSGFHASGGAGLWLVWDADFVIRLESGLSAERFFWGLLLRSPF